MNTSWPFLTIGSQSVHNKIDVRWYNVIASMTLVPLVSIAGVAGNLLILTLMPRASVHISRRAKQFYCLLAVCDLFVVLSHYVASFLLHDTLYFISGGRFFLSIEFTNRWDGSYEADL